MVDIVYTSVAESISMTYIGKHVPLWKPISIRKGFNEWTQYKPYAEYEVSIHILGKPWNGIVTLTEDRARVIDVTPYQERFDMNYDAQPSPKLSISQQKTALQDILEYYVVRLAQFPSIIPGKSSIVQYIPGKMYKRLDGSIVRSHGFSFTIYDDATLYFATIQEADDVFFSPQILGIKGRKNAGFV